MIKLRNRIEQLFPYKPYPSQIDLCENIYKSLLDQRKMSIFESPTGTGKSVCSIIGALLWLIDSYDGTLEKNEKQKTEGLPDWFNDVETEQVPLTLNKKSDEVQRKHPEHNQKINLKNQVKNQSDDDQYQIDVESDEESNYKSTISYLKTFQSTSKPLKLIYASRTHSQIKQWANEISKITSIKSRIKLVSLGSRQQLCVNSSVVRQAGSNMGLLKQICKQQQKDKADTEKMKSEVCPYYVKYKAWKNQQGSQFKEQNILDIEDLKKEGTKCLICPYYASKELESECEVICLPYQLLLDRLDDFRDQVILIDEAHNLASAIQSNSSVAISCLQLDTVHEGLLNYKKRYQNKVKPKTLYLLNKVTEVAKKLKDIIEVNQLEGTKKFCLLQFMMDLSLINFDLSQLLMFLNNKQLMVRLNGFIDNYGKRKAFQCWETFAKFTSMIILSNEKDYILYKEKDQESQYSLKIKCLKNHNAMMDLVYRSRSVILIGGTMQPLNELEVFQENLEPEKFQLQSFPHIIPEQNCKLFIIPGLNQPLSLNFKNKQDKMSEILHEVNNILDLLIKSIPMGIVVFFTSYQMLENVRQYLGDKKFSKKLFWDNPKSQDLLQNYQKEIQNKQGAVLFSVVGGILSEGINFSDDLCRGIVVIGVPYPNMQSIEVQEQLKIQKDPPVYLDNLAMKAVNQSVGRAIRHNKDYSLMFLVDCAYTDNRLRGKLSGWIQSRISIIKSSYEIEKQAIEFFNNFLK